MNALLELKLWEAFYKDVFGFTFETKNITPPPATHEYPELLVISSDLSTAYALERLMSQCNSIDIIGDGKNKLFPIHDDYWNKVVHRRKAQEGSYALRIRPLEQARESNHWSRQLKDYIHYIDSRDPMKKMQEKGIILPTITGKEASDRAYQGLSSHYALKAKLNCMTFPEFLIANLWHIYRNQSFPNTDGYWTLCAGSVGRAMKTYWIPWLGLSKGGHLNLGWRHIKEACPFSMVRAVQI